MKTLISVSAALTLLGVQSHALAQWRCDCTTVTATCSATVTLETNAIEVATNTAQCARVDYLVDGLPFVSVVVDGQAREDWITRSADPQVIVQGCQVCRDNAGAANLTPRTTATPQVAEAPSTAAAAESTLTPLVAPQPTYPDTAEARGIEGYVTLEFTVNPFGDIANAHVVASEPRGVFDLAALSAVSRWRYPSDPDREPTTIRDTIRFNLDDYIWRSPGGAASAAAPAQAPPGPLNRCLRENVSYNYGEMVEVGLIDACATPLVVFACAVGTGAVAERWVCQSSESQSTVLIPPGDARNGTAVTVETDSVQRQYRYTDNFYVARAPNTEYWWIACGINDRGCREEARRWSSGLDRRTASIDPSQRARLEPGRSY
jgi:TonB family protein